MNIKPLADRVLVKRLEETEELRGGIIIPDSAREKPMEAEVIAVGPGRILDDGTRAPVDVHPGENVVVGKYSGSEVNIGDATYVIIKESEILAISGDPLLGNPPKGDRPPRQQPASRPEPKPSPRPKPASRPRTKSST